MVKTMKHLLIILKLKEIFNKMDETFQKRIIRHLLENSKAYEKFCHLNPFLKNIPDPHRDRRRISHNQRTVLNVYAKKVYSRRLKATYRKVVDCKAHHNINKQKLLNAFLNPTNASLLKWSPYVPC